MGKGKFGVRLCSFPKTKTSFFDFNPNLTNSNYHQPTVFSFNKKFVPVWFGLGDVVFFNFLGFLWVDMIVDHVEEELGRHSALGGTGHRRSASWWWRSRVVSVSRRRLQLHLLHRAQSRS